jgi:hypothetical protein
VTLIRRSEATSAFRLDADLGASRLRTLRLMVVDFWNWDSMAAAVSVHWKRDRGAACNVIVVVGSDAIITC